jgi:hypothetical protein
MHTIEKTVRLGNGTFNERLHIKAFKSSAAMHDFLNHEDNALFWKESKRELKAGVYAFAGGNWHNTKNLDHSVLAHI